MIHTLFISFRFWDSLHVVTLFLFSLSLTLFPLKIIVYYVTHSILSDIFTATLGCPNSHPYTFNEGSSCCSSLIDAQDPGRLLGLYDPLDGGHCSDEIECPHLSTTKCISRFRKFCTHFVNNLQHIYVSSSFVNLKWMNKTYLSVIKLKYFYVASLPL